MFDKLKNIASHDVFGWPTADQAVVSGGNFLLAILLARYIGVESYGSFVLMWTVILFFSSIHQAAIIAPLQTIISLKKRNKDRWAFHSFVINLTFVFGCAILVMIFVLINESFSIFADFDNGFELVLLLITFLTYDYIRKSLYVLGEVQQSFLLSLVSYGLCITVVLLKAFFGTLNTSDSLLIYALCFGISSFVGIIKVRFYPFYFPIYWSLWSDYFQYSKWLSITALLQWFNTNVFIISSATILGPAAAGVIRACQNIVGVLHVLYLTVENIVPVKTAQTLSSHGISPMFNYLYQFSLKTGALVLIILSGIFILSDYILLVAYGDQYMQFGYVLKGFTLLYILAFVVIPLKIALRTLERTRVIFSVYVVSAVIGALISTPFILKWHYVGAVAGLIAIQGVVLIGYLFSIRKEIKNYANHSFSIR